MSAGEPGGEALVDQLDLAAVGYILIKSVAVSRHVGHKHLRGTMQDYVNDGDGPLEAQFVRDVIAETTDAVVAKWFNDDAWKVSEWVFKGGAGE